MIDESAMDKTLGKNLPLLFKKKVSEVPNYTLQAVKNKSGVFVRYSYAQVYQHVIEIASQLKKLGIKRGDFVGMISDNRREWFITDMALLTLGAADVPRGCDSQGVEIRFILNYAGCQYSVFENSRQLSKALENVSEIPNLKTAIMFDPADDETAKKASEAGIKIVNWSLLEAEGAHVTKDEWLSIENEMEQTQPEEIATIIFTSGTTGTPKGVMLTHDNYVAQCEVCHTVLGLMQSQDLWLTVLPIWHSFERAFCYMVVALKGGFAYSKPVASLMLQDLAAIQPEWMCGVPRLFESVVQGIYRNLKKNPPLQRLLFSFSIWFGKLFYRAKERVFGLVCRYRWYPRFIDVILWILPYLIMFLPHLACEFLVYRKIRSCFGGKMRAAISGGGALQKKTEDFFHAIGFNILEGYGMTETAPVISVRNSKTPRSNNVGFVFPSLDVKIVAQKDGKIAGDQPLKPGKKGLVLVKGRQVMKGYYKQEELTAETIDKDGWLNTGDLGMLSYDNELKLTGRAKETIVLLGGENIEPQVIEKALNQSPYIERSVVVGQDQKYVAALIVPDSVNVIQYAEENHVFYDDYDTLLKTTEIQNLFRSEIDRLDNAKTGFRACERIFKFGLLSATFEIGREINAKQELVRPKIVKLYKKEYNALFK